MTDEVKMIPIEQIRVLNPRHRDQKKFELIVQSIKNLGLKKPIHVSLRSENEGEKPGYDLICGQGRIEAFTALGHKEIPAIVVEISKEERLVRSLVENIARRNPQPMDLIREIERLQTKGYNFNQISKKLNVCHDTVNGLMALKNAGEERLLEAAVTGKIPLWVAIDIAKTDSVQVQRELLKAYENKQLNHLSIRTVKRLIEQRRLIGKQCGGGVVRHGIKTSAESLVKAYRRESQRQKLLVKKAKICDARLVFVITAFSKLLTDENFVTLLRAESFPSMPKSLWAKMGLHDKHPV
jgi:ParB family chromosome partitioning protein